MIKNEMELVSANDGIEIRQTHNKHDSTLYVFKGDALLFEIEALADINHIVGFYVDKHNKRD